MAAWKARIVPLLILVVALLLRVEDPQPVQLARLWTFDTYQRIEPRVYDHAQPVRILDIDDESLARIGQWPWPRSRIAEMVDRLHDAGAAVVVFDVLFAEPDRTSPANMVADWPAGSDDADLRARIAALPDHDQLLAAAFARGRVVAGFTFTRSRETAPPPVPKAGIGLGGSPPHPFLPAYGAAIANLPALGAAADGVGNINFEADADGLIRRVPLFTQYVAPGTTPTYDDPFALPPLYPTLGAEALRVAQSAQGFNIRMSDASGEGGVDESSGIAEVRIGQLRVPTSGDGHVWLRYTGHEPARYVSAWRLWSDAEPIAAADGIEGAIILVGTSAPGLFDLRATPLNSIIPGVEVHAELVEQILNGSFLTRPDWTLGAELAAFALLGVFLVLLLPKLGVAASAVVCLTAITAGVAAGWFAFTTSGVLIDPVFPALVVLVVYLSSSLITYLQSETQRRLIRTAFGQYLSPALVEQLADQPERLRLGGETREMTLLFCDIRGFTSISEEHRDDPQALTSLINRLLTPLSAEILERDGTIDKYMGDCIMAFWNAPIDDPAHAAHACDAALAMLRALERVNEVRCTENPDAVAIAVGIGLNTGECVVGNMGSDQRFDYSVLGDAVNLAARLEGQSGPYGMPIIVGESTHKQVADDFAFLELDLIAVKGKREAVRIYALLGDAHDAAGEGFQALQRAHAQMLDAYRARDWDRAQDALNVCAEMPGAVGTLYDLYAERIFHYSFDPPPEDWKGIHVAEMK
ncbi:MAG: adenylate/guanylate cyclase domain-containing protein [Proteobacteria bacterium]|nr:adenylate/guanylate cyclase domain-containing protein [Pseudomonadota bacterium]